MKTTTPVPSREEVIGARHYSQLMVEASKRGERTYEEARAACQHYIDLAYARQQAVFGTIRCRLNIHHLLR